MSRRPPSPDEVFAWAAGWAACRPGRGTLSLPSLRDASRRWRLSYDELEDIISGWSGDGYLGIAVAVQCGSGVGSLGSRGSHLIEAYS